MIRLSDRLQMIADQIETGERVCDIGTDHGFLPLYLYETGKSPHVIMSDVSSGSLQKARENCIMYHPGQEFDLRLGNGLQVLETGEVDTVVIAGMGGILMTQILEENMEKTMSVKKYILQPRSASGKLRHWLMSNGFEITSDRLVEEGKFICSIITAVPAENADMPLYSDDDIRMEIPETLKNESLIEEFVRRRIVTEKNILKEMRNGSSAWDERIKSKEKEIEYLEGYL